jgi:flagellar hook-basal body complex protein FliE
MGSLQSLQDQADATAVTMAAGGPVDLHDVMIASEKAALGFQLALQLRNKVVEAYQEIMRMQV